MELIIQHEKNRNDQLMRKIQELEEQVNRAGSKPATPTPPAPEHAEKSPLENLVQQALNRMNELEHTIKNSQKSDVASSGKGGVEKSKGPSAGSKEGKKPTHESDDDSWHDSDNGDDDDGEESDDETITTPTGQTVS